MTMKFTKKMVLVPHQDGGARTDGEDIFGNTDTESTHSKPHAAEAKPESGGNRIRRYAADRQRKMLVLVLKLALAGGYDTLGMMKSLDGESIDIIPLLIYSLSPGRNITGLEDFVRLLHEAGVLPSDVINSHVRDMLIRRMSGPKKDYSRKPGSPPPDDYTQRQTRRDPVPSPPQIPLPQIPESDHQLPPGDEVMDSRTKRVIGEVDSDSNLSNESRKRSKNTEQGYDWDADDSDLD